MGQGLYQLQNGAYVSRTSSKSSVKLESFVSIREGFIFCGLKLDLPAGGIAPFDKENLSCYRVGISLCLTAGEHPALRGSALTNTYYFSSDDFSCVGFTGSRIARSIEEDSTFAPPLSSFVSSYEKNGIVTSDGVLWNAEQYTQNAAFSLETIGAVSTVVAEFRIPLEDALLSVHPSNRDAVRMALNGSSGSLCGGFSSRVDLNTAECVVVGLPSDYPSPFSEGETMKKWMGRSYEIPRSGRFIPDIIPVPLYWVGKAPKKSASAVFAQVENTEAPHTTSSSTQTTTLPVPTTTLPDVTVSNSSKAENDESIFKDLPDASDLIPEDTEIVYDEKSVTTKSRKDGYSVESAVLATITGALIFASVMILCIYFRDSGKEAEENRKKRKKKKSTNEKDGKNKK